MERCIYRKPGPSIAKRTFKNCSFLHLPRSSLFYSWWSARCVCQQRRTVHALPSLYGSASFFSEPKQPLTKKQREAPLSTMRCGFR